MIINQIDKFYFALIFPAILLSLFACSDNLLSGEKISEDASIIENYIIESLDDYVMGYSYSISHRGVPILLDARGYARNKTDGIRDFRTDDKVHIAHLSQFISSISSVLFLKERGIDLDSKIYPHLPKWWQMGKNIDQISFTDLLTHQSGFNRSGTQRPNAATIDSIQVMIEYGSELNPKQYFSNQNYALMRILIPLILDRESGLLGPVPVDIDYGIVFRDHIRKKIVPLAGLKESDLNTYYIDDNPVLAYYSIEDSGVGYGGRWNFLLLSGAFGFVINMQNMTNFWNSFWYNDNFIKSEDRSWITKNRAGLFDSIDRDHETYYMQTGSWTYASNQAGQQKSIETIAAHFPGDWNIVIFTNSPHKNHKSLLDVAVNAYESL